MKDSLPSSYYSFIHSEELPMINNLPLLVGEEHEFSEVNGLIGWAQFLLQMYRPSLSDDYIPIRIHEDYALCFKKDSNDLLFEIDLLNKTEPKTLDNTFSLYLEEYKSRKKHLENELDFIKGVFFGRNAAKMFNRLDAKKNFKNQTTRLKKKAKTKPKNPNSNWNLIRSCVHDRVVGLISYQLDSRNYCINVGVFLTSDHPKYQKWNSLKAVLSLLFCEAHKLGIPPRLQFRRSELGKNKLPLQLTLCLEEIGFSVNCSIHNNLEPELTVELTSVLLGVSSKEMKLIESDSSISLAGLCYLLANDVWGPLATNYILHNTSYRSELLFGKIHVEDNPLLYGDLVHLGMNAVLLDHFTKKLFHDPKAIEHEEFNSFELSKSIENNFVRFTSNSFFSIPWLYKNESYAPLKEIKLSNDYTILPYFRYVGPNESESFQERIISLGSYNTNVSVILTSYEHQIWLDTLFKKNHEAWEKLIASANSQKVLICCSPYDVNELKTQVIIKMKSANNVST